MHIGSAENSKTVAGGYGEGNGTHEFCFPYGLAVYDEQTVVVADWGNHRIVQWKVGAKNGQVVAGGHGQGNQFNQLSCPTDVLIDKETDTLIICDRGNNRVVRWSRQDGTSEGEILLDNIACWGLAMDAHRFLYICDIERHEVRRYQIGEKNGTVVAGGRGRGSALNQLNQPTYVFVDQQQTVYVSDTWNHRVMKWKKDATEGIVAVRGSSRGLYVDSSETIYVADYRNHQLVGWAKEATEGTIIAGGYDGDKETSQLYHPWGLSYDQHGQLFVADHSNHRVQRFPLEPTD